MQLMANPSALVIMQLGPQITVLSSVDTVELFTLLLQEQVCNILVFLLAFYLPCYFIIFTIFCLSTFK